MSFSNTASRVLVWLMVVMCCSCTLAWAKTTGSMDVKPGVYKLKSGSKLPIKGPIIKVYAEGPSIQYSHVADTHKTYPVLVKYTASCSNKGRLTGGDIQIETAKTGINSGGGFSSKSVWVNVPYSKIKSVNPAKQCNQHSKTLSLEKQKKVEQIVHKGFVMRIPNVLSAKGTAFCTAAGLGKGDVASDKTDSLGVYIHCVANPKARAPRKTVKTSTPKPPDPGKATTNFKSALLSLKNANSTGKCPVPIKASGSITAKSKGSIEYQWLGDGNYQSPKKTLKFNKAGTKTFSWSRMIRKQDSGSTLAVSGKKTDPNRITGWMQLKVTYKLKNKVAYTKKSWLSKKKKFSVNCGAKPARLAQ